MSSERRHRLDAAAIGCCAASLFWPADIIYLSCLPPDPQMPIADFLSPIYALWFGVAVGVLSLAVLIAPASIRNRRYLTLILFAGFGACGLLMLCGGIVSEHYQMTPPTR